MTEKLIHNHSPTPPDARDRMAFWKAAANLERQGSGRNTASGGRTEASVFLSHIHAKYRKGDGSLATKMSFDEFAISVGVVTDIGLEQELAAICAAKGEFASFDGKVKMLFTFDAFNKYLTNICFVLNENGPCACNGRFFAEFEASSREGNTNEG